MTLRNEACFADLEKDLKDFSRGRRIVEIVNTGNWGDGLIHAGQREFLDNIGLSPIRIPVNKLNKKSSLSRFFLSRVVAKNAIITGNGAFREFYDRPAQLIEAATNFSNVLVMPSSYPFVPAFDQERTRYWRRDQVESVDAMPEASFCHDMAFYLDPSPRVAKRDTAYFFRIDVEKDDFELPAQNVDLSSEGTHATDHNRFLDRIGEYNVIHTNRLHVGIGGALLGREVHLYGSLTRKVQSIFKTSLKPFYKNVYFHSGAPDPNVLGKD